MYAYWGSFILTSGFFCGQTLTLVAPKLGICYVWNYSARAFKFT